MRIKTMAILITEDTYPIAVACLPAGFAAYPFDNAKGFWLVINVPGLYDRNSFDGDGVSPLITLHNLWISQSEFLNKYKIINQRPGRKAENVWAWVEVERVLDKDLKERLEGTDEEVGPYTRRKNVMHRRVFGYYD